MAGQVYLSLLNPSIAFSFAGLAALLCHRWPAQIHLFPLSLAFFYLGLGFITQEWPLLSPPGSINYAGNALFFAAVVLACSSAMIRARVRVPLLLFGLTSMAAVAGFIWFAFVMPSTLARVYFLNGCYVVLSLITAMRLLDKGVHSLADRLFFAAVAFGGALSAVRPFMVVSSALEVEVGGAFAQTDYWNSILAMTPFISILVVSLFVFALVLDMMSGLQRVADHDYLTGLLNRRGFETGAEAQLDAGRGRQSPAALLIADIDDFKQINDRFGHAIGDDVIAAVGRVLDQHGQANRAGRIGGEEFALFYEASSRRMLERCAENIRSALAELRVESLPAGHLLTISIGLHIRTGEESLAEMMRQADRALYDAKAAGKNRAVLTPMRLRSV